MCCVCVRAWCPPGPHADRRFVRQWVPELDGVSDAWVHDVSVARGRGRPSDGSFTPLPVCAQVMGAPPAERAKMRTSSGRPTPFNPSGVYPPPVVASHEVRERVLAAVMQAFVQSRGDGVCLDAPRPGLSAWGISDSGHPLLVEEDVWVLLSRSHVDPGWAHLCPLFLCVCVCLAA